MPFHVLRAADDVRTLLPAVVAGVLPVRLLPARRTRCSARLACCKHHTRSAVSSEEGGRAEQPLRLCRVHLLGDLDARTFTGCLGDLPVPAEPPPPSISSPARVARG